MVNIVEKVVELSGAPGSTDKNGADFDLLRDAVLTANLAGPLSDPGASLTVFVPNDAAFVGLAQTLGYAGSDEAGAFGHIVDALTLLGGGDPIPLLTSVLTYHVAPGEAFLADVAALGDGAMITTLQGGRLTLDLDAPGLVDLDPGLPDPNLIGFDVDVSNGVIHVLDGVLLPLSASAILSQPGTDFIIGDGDGEIFNTRGGNDFVDGNGGNDVILVGAGNDVAIGGAGDDRLLGFWGKDTLLGGSGNDKIFAGAGDDRIDGGAGDDVIYGGRGSDIINGGTGDDILTSGWGNDIFVFEAESGHDTVMWFRDGRDRIDLSGHGIEDFSEIEHSIKGGFARTKIELSDDDSITMIGTWSFQIDEHDFIFA